MAEVDSRIETLEDEIKVLKGEVRRTLVDLRALLMREDSPLNDSSFGRRGDGDQGGEPGLSRKEVFDMVKEATEAARAATPDPPVQVSRPEQPHPEMAMANAAPGFPNLGPGPGAPPPGMFPMGNPMFGAGAGFPQAPPPGLPQASAVPDAALLDQERRIEERRRQLEEQERRLADQARSGASESDIADQKRQLEEQRRQMEKHERQLAEQLKSAAQPDPALAELERKLEEQERKLAEQARNAGKPDRAKATTEKQDKKGLAKEEADSRLRRVVSTRRELNRKSRDEDREDDLEEEIDTRRRRVVTTRRELIRKPRDEEWDDDPEEEEEELEAGAEEEDDEDWDDELESPPAPRREVGRSKRNGNGVGRRDHAENGRKSERHPQRTHNGSSSRVYEEYLDLLEETKELDATEDGGKAKLPLDVNLLSSLTRWASIAKRRVGEQRLNDVLNLYAESGHLTSGMRELLGHICNLVDEVPPQTPCDAQDCVDLISHLHGILAGGVFVRRAQEANLPAGR